MDYNTYSRLFKIYLICLYSFFKFFFIHSHFNPALFSPLLPSCTLLLQIFPSLVQIFEALVPFLYHVFSRRHIAFSALGTKLQLFLQKGVPLRARTRAPRSTAPPHRGVQQDTLYIVFFCIFVPIYIYICNRPCPVSIPTRNSWYKNWYNLVQICIYLYHACPQSIHRFSTAQSQNRPRRRFCPR